MTLKAKFPEALENVTEGKAKPFIRKLLIGVSRGSRMLHQKQ
jgi:hypothetical protein